MKILTPARPLAEAADVVAPVRDEVVVIGAAALQVALAESAVVVAAATGGVHIFVITPTRDVDVGLPTERAATILAHLEQAGMRRSEVEHERSFTWVRGDLKVQLAGRQLVALGGARTERQAGGCGQACGAGHAAAPGGACA